MTHLAIDLGTTNTVLATWREGKAEVIDLPGLTVRRGPQATPLIPSIVCPADGRGRRLAVGRAAAETGGDACLRSFKPYLLSRDPARRVRTVRGRALSGIEIAALFLQGVLRAFRLHHGGLAGDLRSVTAPAPVEAFEPYRAALQRNLDHGLGAMPFHSLDEPLAAALGYGLGLHRERVLLVVDFGGGTLDLAVVRLGPDPKREAGRVTTLAKQGLSLGGDDLDLWLAQEMAAQSGQRWEDLRPWHGQLKEAAEAAKIALSTHLQTTFSAPEAGYRNPHRAQPF